MSESTTNNQTRMPESVSIAELSTTLSRARCPQPTQLKRMRQSLSQHGQMTPVIAVERSRKLELVDGFKRRAAALQMGWKSLLVSRRPLDDRAQWVAMLALNRASSMSVLEEALILRELVQAGMMQTEVAQLVGRHKTWVCRRLGLIERLHPDLLEWVRTGLLSPGTARRLYVLPPGNQVEIAAVVKQQNLSTQQAELLVSLWHKTSDPEVRRFLLTSPLEALQHAKPDDPATAIDPRLTPRGQTLQRSLRILQGVMARALNTLRPAPTTSDLEILTPDLRTVARILPALLEAVGTASRSSSCAERNATTATPAS